MAEYNQNSHSVIPFHNFPVREEGSALAGYAALIDAHNLRIPLPAFLSVIGKRHKRHIKGLWHIYTPRHRPEESLQGHLTFALKNEGIDLGVLKALFIVIRCRRDRRDRQVRADRAIQSSNLVPVRMAV